MAKNEEEDRRPNASPCQSPSDRTLKRRLNCIVKLGGAAITCKHEIEKINEQNLEAVSSQLRQAMIGDSLTEKVHGTDWSRRHGMSEVAVAEDFKDRTSLQLNSFVIVHGAVEITVASHDTAGGMEGKILEAAMIAKLGIDVYITKAGTPHSLRALSGRSVALFLTIGWGQPSDHLKEQIYLPVQYDLQDANSMFLCIP